MATISASPVLNPTKLEDKVQSGRVEKTRRKGDAKTPTYRIGGRTFACEACKKGHRVSKCTHAGERPLSMTNDPGRPSADQKRHCDCPKSCSCTKRNCRCERTCNCTQVMYMLVYVPLHDGEDSQNDAAGEWQIGKEVITDLKGKALSEEEVKNRALLKSLQQNAMVQPRKMSHTGGHHLSVSSPKAQKPEDVDVTPAEESPPPPTCCQHRKKIIDEAAPAKTEPPTRERKKIQCDCGSSCNCAFCLDHPNNQTSQLIAQQQITHFTRQGYVFPQHVDNNDLPWLPPQKSGSCMGTNPRFAMSSIPNPSPIQFQSLFPASNPTSQGYMLSYPIIRYTGQINSPEHLPTFAPVTTMQPLMIPPLFADHGNVNCQDLIVDSLIPFDATSPGFRTLESTQPFQPDYDIGDAVVADFQKGHGQMWTYDPSTIGTSTGSTWFADLGSPDGTAPIQYGGGSQNAPRAQSLSRPIQPLLEHIPELPSLDCSSIVFAAPNRHSKCNANASGADTISNFQFDGTSDGRRSPQLPYLASTYT